MNAPNPKPAPPADRKAAPALNPKLGIALLGVFFAVMIILTFVYSHGSKTLSQEDAKLPPTPPALSPEQIEAEGERYDAPLEPTPPLPEIQEFTIAPASAYPIAPPVARPSLDQRYRERFDQPLSPPRRAGSTAPTTPSAENPNGGLPDFQTTVDRLLGAQLAAANLGAAGAGPLGAPSSPSPAPVGALELRAQTSHPYELPAGALLPAVLTHRYVSRTGGPLRAHITRDVLDPRTGVVLVPQGTVALGEGASAPVTGDRALLIAWTRLRFPDGTSLELPPQGTSALDGAAGATGSVNRHFLGRFGSAILLSAVGAGVQLSQPQRSATAGAAPSEGQIAASELGLNLGRLSEEILRRGLDKAPTITLDAGTQFHIQLQQPLRLAPFGA